MASTLLFTFSPTTINISSCPFLSNEICHQTIPLTHRLTTTRSTSHRKRLRTPTSHVTTATTFQSSQTPVQNSVKSSSSPPELSTNVEELSSKLDSSSWLGIVRMYETLAQQHQPEELPQRLYSHVFFVLMKLGRGKGKHVRLALTIWNRVRLAKVASLSELLSPKSFNFLHVLFSRAVLIDEAIQVRESCHQSGYYLNRYSYNAFLNACAKVGRVDDALNTLRDMAEHNVLPDVVSCNVIISCCVKSGNIEVALSILERMKSWGIPPDVYSYNSVINGLRKSNMLDEAFALVKYMEQEADNEAKRLAEQAKTLEKVSDLDQTQEEVDFNIDVDENSLEMADSTKEERIPQTSIKSDPRRKYTTTVSPDLVTYNTLISGIASLTKPDLSRAFAVKTHMEARGLQSNEVTYNSLMAVAARADQPEDAFSIYDEMLSKNLKPNCECYTTLITMCGRSGLTTRAFELHDHMIQSGIQPSVVTFNALLTVCRRAESDEASDAALQVVEIMRKTPGCEPDVITYSTIIDALGRGRRLNKVIEVVNQMTRAGVKPNLVTYTSMVSAFVRAGDLSGALKILDEMERNGIQPNVYTFSSLINGAGRLGEFDKAIEILKMMKSRGIQANRITYSTLIQYVTRSGTRESIVKILDQLLNDTRLKNTPQEEKLLELRREYAGFTGSKKRILTHDVLSVLLECFPDKKDLYLERKHIQQ